MRRHELDLVSLGAGVVFVLLAVGHLLGGLGGNSLDMRWVAPVLLVALGVAGVAGALRNRDTDRHTSDSDRSTIGADTDTDTEEPDDSEPERTPDDLRTGQVEGDGARSQR